jgi:hypothetical protein
MTWLTWRQIRGSAVATYSVLLLIAVFLAVTGPQLAHLSVTAGSDFLSRVQADRTDTTLYITGLVAVLATPPLIGAFWGAPLIARELDDGTHRLVWNQTISRTRWLAAKLIVCGALAMAATGLLSLAVTWWSGPIDTATDAATSTTTPIGLYYPRLAVEVFPARGLVPVGYAAFAFMLGVTLGLLLRRLLPAMALTVAGYIAAQVVTALWIRRAVLAPAHLTMRITGTDLMNFNGGITLDVPRPGAWVTGQQLADNAGHPAVLPSWATTCFGSAPGQENAACFAKLHSLYQVVVSYQPAGRFWALQYWELGGYLVLALALAAACTYWIRKRVS